MIEWDRSSIRKSLEIFFIILVLYMVNLFFFPEDPGFFKGVFNPYNAMALLTAAYFGKFFGFAALLLTTTAAIIPIGSQKTLTPCFSCFWTDHAVELIIQIVGVYILGMIRDSYSDRILRYRDIARKEITAKHKFKNEAEALSDVNRELEERVLRQQDSITLLYSQIKALHSQSLTETLSILLQTVNKFTWAKKASVWRYEPSTESLVMIANIGWQAEDYENSIVGVDESIEGWSYRNKMLFSIRMLLQYENLLKMDNKRNILTLPITFSGRSWGVLNIEEMPFTKYNLYNEKIMSILVDLASPEIERAVEYESYVTYEETNPHTGLPSYVQLINLIEKGLSGGKGEQNSYSLILIEFINFSEILESFGQEKTWKLLMNLMERLSKISENNIDFFHYKDLHQIALYYPDIDYDGVSMFCLEALGVINDMDWNIDDTPVNLEAILGYSSSGQNALPPDELFSTAEILLEMQKV